jgi:hypothetical protein
MKKRRLYQRHKTDFTPTPKILRNLTSGRILREEDDPNDTKNSKAEAMEESTKLSEAVGQNICDPAAQKIQESNRIQIYTKHLQGNYSKKPPARNTRFAVESLCDFYIF